MTRKMIIAVLTVLACAVFTGYQAHAATVVRYGHGAAEDQPQHQGALAFARYVAERTGGEIEVQVFPLGQLGPERSMVEQVQMGTLQMTTASPSVLANYVREMGVIELPFIYPNRAAAYKVLDDPEVKARLSAYCASIGLTFIGYTETGYRDVTNWRKAVKSPADLKGLKIRVMEGPLSIDTFKALGAAPVTLGLPEVYDALRQRLIDGQEYPLYTAIRLRFTVVNKHATMTDHILGECPVIVNKKLWDSLSPGRQAVFREAAEIQTRVNREGAEKNLATAVERTKAIGVELTVLTPEERAAFKAAVKPVLDKYRDLFGAQWYDFFVGKIGQ